MVTVSDELKSAFNSGTQKDLTLAFSNGTSLTNENIVAESMTIEQTLCDEQQLTFGLCNASSFKIRVVNSNTSRIGLTVTPTITAYDENDTAYPYQLGIYTIVEDKVTDDRLYRDITAYDSLYDVVNTNYIDWYNSLTFPMTMANYRNSFFSHIGITQVSTTLINDSMTIEKTVELDSYSGSAILKSICELNAVFGCIDNEGHFKYIPFINEGGLYPEDDLYPDDDLYPNDGFDVVVNGTEYTYVAGSFVYEDYTCKHITGISISEEESDTATVYGEEGNVYSITGNYLTFGKSASDLETIASNIYEYVKSFIYTPARIQMRAMPWVELGDIIGVIGQQGNAVFPILKRSMNGITALYDDYEAQGQEYYTFSANTTSGLIQKLKSKTLRIQADVDGVTSELAEYREDTDETLATIIEQTATSISLTATDGGTSAGLTIKLYNEDGTELSSDDANITLSGLVKFTDLSTSGSTTINGSNITTGTINADLITTGTMSANRVRTGSITSTSGAMSIDLDNSTITANQLVVNATNFGLTSDGVVTINSGTISGFSVDGYRLKWGDASGYYGAIIKTTASGSAYYSLAIGSSTHDTYSDAKFRVGKDGIMTACSAYLYDYVRIGHSGKSDVYLTTSGGTLSVGATQYLDDGNVKCNALNSATVTTSVLTTQSLTVSQNYTRGHVTITPSAANTPTGAIVYWTLSNTPTVTLTANTSVPGTVVTGVAVTDVSSSRATFWLTRTSTTSTGIYYIASCING